MTLGRNHSWGIQTARANACRHLLCLALTLLALLAAPSAFAQAPMCDPSGATVMAPLPAPPSDDGEIAALNCPTGPELTDQVHPGRPLPPPLSTHFVQDEGGLLPLRLVAHAGPQVIVTSYGIRSPGLLGPAGYHSGVFRPPRTAHRA
jgi:hypothetical protein